ncbi:MAG: hypothetical protein OJF52_000826 [Nitrospira sp.]|nr:MAG: hypothetical protein OJF52_000826 [Nitrospira sp.]
MNRPDRSAAPITMAIVSKNHLVRLGLQGVIKAQQHILLIGEATSTLEAEDLVVREKPHVLVIEMEPEIDLMNLVRRIKTSVPTTRVIVLSGIEDKQRTLQALSSGIDGIVLNVQPAAVLLATIDHVSRLPIETLSYERNETNHLEVSGPTGGDSPRPTIPTGLDTVTEREREIIVLVGQGLSNKTIADRLSISNVTVRHHLTNIFDKLGVTNRQKLLIRAHQYGLVEFRASA